MLCLNIYCLKNVFAVSYGIRKMFVGLCFWLVYLFKKNEQILSIIIRGKIIKKCIDSKIFDFSICVINHFAGTIDCFVHVLLFNLSLKDSFELIKIVIRKCIIHIRKWHCSNGKQK